MWFQHDSFPANDAFVAKTVLDCAFCDRWSGRGGPITWLAHSPTTAASLLGGGSGSVALCATYHRRLLPFVRLHP
jgi:hypothetical protein